MDELRIVLNADEQLRVNMQETTPLSLRLQNLEIHTVTNNYEDLDNKPSINSVELVGNKTTSDLGLQSELSFDNTPTADSTNPVTSGGVKTAVDAKVSKTGDTMTGTLLAPTMKVYDASYPMFVLQSSASDASALGAVYEDLANRQLVLRQRSTAGYVEDYSLPVNTATSANGYYQIVTGKGYLNGTYPLVKSPTIDTAETPSTEKVQDVIALQDKSGNTTAFVSGYHRTNGNIGFQMLAARPINGSYAVNGITLEVASDGTFDVGVSAPMQWRKALNGQEIKVRSGTTVITPGSNSTSETVITSAQLATMFGISGSSPSNTTVMMSNGDYVANAVGVSSIYNSNVAGWKALFSEPISTPIRINWIAVYFGL